MKTRFRKKIIKLPNINDKENPIVLISIVLEVEDQYSIMTPFTDYLMKLISNKPALSLSVANVIIPFLNYVYFDMENPISSLTDITIDMAVDFLNNRDINQETLIRYSLILTKFYFALYSQNILRDVPKDIFSFHTGNGSHYALDNIFAGRCEPKTAKQKSPLIHEINQEYLIDFIQCARTVAPCIALGVFCNSLGALENQKLFL